ncbi:putative dioxygenase of extradiol dioxygenase family [Actinobacteria bacterium IMCC26256]|nr:putative dioxygenase of extradiol dioxygenase family [Actinobacteria bacterium IMCC26256]
MTDRPVLHLSLPVDDLHAARDFYENTLGCRIGREREDWFDAWFYGLQLTLQLRPLEVMTVSQQDVRHFGVVLPSLTEFDEVVERVAVSGHPWISKPEIHSDAELNGKLGGKLADPSGNIIEIKFYADSADFLS